MKWLERARNVGSYRQYSMKLMWLLLLLLLLLLHQPMCFVDIPPNPKPQTPNPKPQAHWIVGVKGRVGRRAGKFEMNGRGGEAAHFWKNNWGERGMGGWGGEAHEQPQGRRHAPGQRQPHDAALVGRGVRMRTGPLHSLATVCCFRYYCPQMYRF